MEKIVVELEITITSPAGQRVQTATSARQYGLRPDGKPGYFLRHCLFGVVIGNYKIITSNYLSQYYDNSR